ncbi:hypothetical protein POTOM_038443 [Populus tomentosa]|uniref:Succinate-semialdehyde dehydrogenase, mitochondrial n=2 Tax=Magnoliopsida TaxID=3398 RepID=A0A8X8CLD2_POPTO|nr:hypothetical protein POTOM_038443 [Populus tomentosa]
MTLGRIALARVPAIRCKIQSLFSAPHSSSSTNRTSRPLSRHVTATHLLLLSNKHQLLFILVLLIEFSDRDFELSTFCLIQMSMKSENLVSKLTSSGLLKTQGLIDGKWVDAHDGDTMKVLNPATGEVVAIVPCMGQSETNNAISSAYDAFRLVIGGIASRGLVMKAQLLLCCLCRLESMLSEEYYGFLPFTESHMILCTCIVRYDLLIAHKEELGQLITLEQGKPLKEAMGEVSYGASFIEFYAEEAKRVYGDIIPATLGDRRYLSSNPHEFLQPVGVVGAITPWNFPLAMITRKVGPALACGCTVVLKPSELTPLTALAAAELALQAGIPPGVLNVVMGKAPDIGDALLASHEVRKITFTGSTAVGKKLMAGAAGTVKRLSLELGGNAPCIVFDDADLDVAVKGSTYQMDTLSLLSDWDGFWCRVLLIVGQPITSEALIQDFENVFLFCIHYWELAAKFRNSGQTCVCANRIIVQEGIYDKFADAFSKAVQSMQVGDGFSEGVTQGPLINEAAVQKVESFVQDAIFKGAKVLLGGKRHSLGMTFYEPTIISNVTEAMLLSRFAVDDKIEGSLGNVASTNTAFNQMKLKDWPLLSVYNGARCGLHFHFCSLKYFGLHIVDISSISFWEEVFGPVAPLLRFKTEEEAILMANNTKAGLAAYIFTNNVQRSWRVTEALEYGLVGVNEGLISTEVAPFGGVKQSGLGREGSKYGMDEYLEVKIPFNAS